MAVFCDLEDDDYSTESPSHLDTALPRYQEQLNTAVERDYGAADSIAIARTIDNQSTTINKIAAALTCYPIALSLSSCLDLNDLHALAASCRSVHASLVQYAHQLKSQSLRCSHDARPMLAEALVAQKSTPRSEVTNEDPEQMQNLVLSSLEASIAAVTSNWPRTYVEGLYASTGLSSKVSSCARDLVASCRKCGTIVCRNCAAKPPSNVRLRERLRRICNTCLAAPIEAHFQTANIGEETSDGLPASGASSVRSGHSCSGSSTSESTSRPKELEAIQAHVFTSPAFLRGPCTCESRGVFLCEPCGSNLRAADTTYQRVFTWRSRYSTHIGGGLGTGLGQGNQGQKCGRGETCLDTSSEAVSWVEIDCSDDRLHEDSDYDTFSRVGTPDSTSNKPGYLQQEVEGIGGVLKKKLKRRVKTGAYTYEYTDERESGKYLERERTGAVRSWCGWCARIVPSKKDERDYGMELMRV